MEYQWRLLFMVATSYSFIHSFILIQAARPIETADKDNDIEAHTNIKKQRDRIARSLEEIIRICAQLDQERQHTTSKFNFY